MTSSIFQVLITLSLVLLPTLLRAANAEDFFHRGATNYIVGNIREAKTLVETGLTNYPGDEMLKALEALLKQQEQQNQQQSKDDQKDQKDQKDQQSKKDQDKQQEQNKKDEQKQQEQNQDN